MYTKEQVKAHVEAELEEVFVRLADRYGLQSGDEDPGAAFHWAANTVPAVVDHVWGWYEGNQSPYVVIHSIDLVLRRPWDATPEGNQAAFRIARAPQSPAGVEVTQWFDHEEPIWIKGDVMDPNDSPELQARVRALLGAV